jgi:hypothetical protein
MEVMLLDTYMLKTSTWAIMEVLSLCEAEADPEKYLLLISNMFIGRIK